MKVLFCFLIFGCSFLSGLAQNKGTDATAALHASPPNYPIPYSIPTIESITGIIDKVYSYLNAATPFQFEDKNSGKVINDLIKIDTNTVWQKGDFRLTSYEWGVVYSGMLLSGEATGDKKFTSYTTERLKAIAQAGPFFQTLYQKYPQATNPLRQVIDPHALDDAGAVCTAAIKMLRATGDQGLKPMIDRYINYIVNKEYRLADGTLARNRPQKNTLWLDDLYMGIPAMAQMGKLTGDKKYFDDAIKQVLQFSKRMFNSEKGIYMHGWVEGMKEHPQFHWARANGWALMAIVELLDVLPENYIGREKVIEQLNAHLKGLVSYQSGQGFWHQLLDRQDSYLETSATAIYAYCLARAINKGWIEGLTYGPACLLAWNAVSTKVNKDGGVEGTCVGTGMAFDPAFYYYRPVNVYAAHGYGPVLLAGAEIINLLKKNTFKIDDSALQWKQ